MPGGSMVTENMIKCPKCGHVQKNSTATFERCESCGFYGAVQGEGLAGGGIGNAIPPAVMGLACIITVGLLFVVGVIAIIVFVVKAISAPAPAPMRRNY